ncbi:Mfa1 family fimbria major subunit [Segatella copri]|uniref:Mfa1 family fimbria major subunit n=1 Tax=Segatella copri TaxID=165179 RepID=UPI001F3A6130|nr:Mfa1 family fimbria major subunit [Segatella copri]
MKKMNLLAMSLVSAAALSFTSCSSNDDLTGGGGSNQSKVEGFYMTLAVQTPTSNGTRTQQQTEKVDATEAESKVTSGTFYLVNAKGDIVFTKNITETEWEKAAPVLTTPGKTQIQVPVQNVTEGETYDVYFLANTTDAKPWTGIYTAPTDISGFAGTYATDSKFAMFNQNDKNSPANKYTVKFEAANKEISHPAQVTGTIKLDRVTARIDKPTTATTTINGVLAEGASELQKKAAADAKKKVKSIDLTSYAITNLSNKTNIMQKWDATWASLQIPADIAYMQKAEDLGNKYSISHAGWFTNEAMNYVFENTATTPTTMYFEYTVTLDGTKFTDTPDCTDGTFYRYNGNIYRSIDAIYAAYKDQPVLFGGKTAEALKAELKITADGKIGATEEELAKFREDNVIEVFRAGKTYYSQVITDHWLGTYTIQRNTVYRLNVKKIFNVGADVPNGEPDENKPMYYLDVEVSVNPWVLSTQDVELGD